MKNNEGVLNKKEKKKKLSSVFIYKGMKE